MTDYKVLIIREKMTFMVNALVINLRRAGYEVRESDMDVSSISLYVNDSDILILYTDEEINGRVKRYKLPEGVKAYSVTVDNNQPGGLSYVSLPGNTIPKGTAVAIKAGIGPNGLPR